MTDNISGISGILEILSLSLQREKRTITNRLKIKDYEDFSTIKRKYLE